MVAFISISLHGNASEKQLAYQENSYPSVYEVVHYCKQQINGGVAASYFDLHKKPDGYFFVVIPISEPQTVTREIKVWDAKTSEYLDFNIDDITSETITYDQFPSIYDRADYFDFHLYYGYGDWTVDVINALENIKNQTLWQLEQLARAYDHQSMDYIRPIIWGKASTIGQKYLKKTGYKNVSKERLDGFMKCADKSLKYYDRIIAKKKDYQTFKIGDVQLKRANNCVHYYNTLLSVKENKLAQKYLNLTEYPKEYIALAEQYIENCAQDGILFTNGDTDTFPLWYVQAKNNYRRDVTIVNLSLLQTFWYMRMQRELAHLNFQTDFNKFEEEESYLFAFDIRNPTESMSVQTLIEEVNQIQSLTYDAPEIQKMNQLMLTVSGEQVPIELRMHYMPLVDLVVLDIIESNPDKSCYFTSPFSLIQSYEINTTFANRGLIYELTSEPQAKFRDDSTNEIFKSEFNKLIKRDYTDWKFYRNYFNELEYHITELQKTDKATFNKLKSEMYELLPDDQKILSNNDLVYLYKLKIAFAERDSENEVNVLLKKLNEIVTKSLDKREFTNRSLDGDQMYLRSVANLYFYMISTWPNNEDVKNALKKFLAFTKELESRETFVDSHPGLTDIQFINRNIEEYFESIEQWEYNGFQK